MELPQWDLMGMETTKGVISFCVPQFCIAEVQWLSKNCSARCHTRMHPIIQLVTVFMISVEKEGKHPEE